MYELELNTSKIHCYVNKKQEKEQFQPYTYDASICVCACVCLRIRYECVLGEDRGTRGQGLERGPFFLIIIF